MQDIYKVDSEKLAMYMSELNKEKDSFIQNVYKTFSDSSFYSTSDSVITTLRFGINHACKQIEDAYSNIISWLDDYSKDIIKLDNSLKNGVVSVLDNETRAYISSFINEGRSVIKKPTSIDFNNEKLDYSQVTAINLYNSHKKGSLIDYSKLNTLSDLELKWLKEDLGIYSKTMIDKSKEELLEELKNKTGIDYSNSSGDQILILCASNSIDLQRERTYGEEIELISKKLQDKEESGYFGLDISKLDEDDIESLKKYEESLDYSKYENMTYEELLKESEGKIRNAKIYNKEGLIKKLAIKDFEIYKITRVSDVYGNYMEHDARSKGYKSLTDYNEQTKKQREIDEAEWSAYGDDWKKFCIYVDKSGFYREWANNNDLTTEQRLKLRSCAVKGITDEKILKREVLGIDNRSFGQKFLGTVTDFTLAFGEGISTGAEAVGDGLHFFGSIMYNYYGNKMGVVSEEEYTKNIKNMEKDIAINYTKEAYDDIYENTSIGKYASANSIDHEMVRGVGNSLGEVTLTAAGMQGLSLASPFIIGQGKGLQAGYENGGDAGKVFVSSLINGGYNAIQYGVAAHFNSGVQYLNVQEKVATNVLVDAVDAATTIPATSAISTIYATGWVDPKTGIYHEFTDDMSYKDRYLKLFEQNGGVEAVFDTTVKGVGFSLLFNGGQELFSKGSSNVLSNNEKYKGKVIEDGIFSDGDITFDESHLSNVKDTPNIKVNDVDVESPDLKNNDFKEKFEAKEDFKALNDDELYKYQQDLNKIIEDGYDPSKQIQSDYIRKASAEKTRVDLELKKRLDMSTKAEMVADIDKLSNILVDKGYNLDEINQFIKNNDIIEIRNLINNPDQIPNLKATPPSYFSNIESFNLNQKLRARDQLYDLANKYNVTRIEMQKILDEKLAELINDNQFGMRISIDSIEKVLDEGYFKGLFETGGVGDGADGLAGIDARGLKEPYMFGLIDDLTMDPNKRVAMNPEDRPVYGVVVPKDIDLNYVLNGPAYGRGKGQTTEAIIILRKEKISSSTSFTIGDSLDYAARFDPNTGQMLANLTASSVENPIFKGGDFQFAQYLNDLNELKNADLTDLFPNTPKDHYLEIQIHGKEAKSWSNIEKVYFASPPSKKIIDKLNLKGILWEVLN